MWNNSLAVNLPRVFSIPGLVVLTLILNACSGGTKNDKTATKTWWLEPYTVQAGDIVDPVPLGVSLDVVPGLDTDRILTLSDSAELNHYSGARWAENLPELLDSISTRSLASSGRFDIVNAMATCELDLEVQEFFAKLGPSDRATGVSVTIKGRYQCENSAQLDLSLTHTSPVHDDRVSGIVAAFQQALDSVLRELMNSLEN